MKRTVTALCLAAMIVGTGEMARAWKYDTHKSTVIEAFSFMEGENGDSSQKWAASFIRYTAGSDIDVRCGIKNGDTDAFYDTSIGGWWVGYRTHVSILGFDTNFTSYWHFVTMFRSGSYGNAYDGYSYKYSPGDGFWGYNGVVKSLLYNQDTRNEGKAGNRISYPESGNGVRDAYRLRYQAPGQARYYSSTPGGNYDDYQKTVYEPCTNAAAYWYGRALNGRTPTTIDRVHAEYLGHVFHMAEDATVTQHVWNTLDHYHTDYEAWVDSNYGILLDRSNVTALVAEFKGAYGITSGEMLRNVTIQQIITFFANKSVNMPGPLYSEDGEVRRGAGSSEYDASVAVNIIILEKFVYDLYAPESERRF